MSALRREHGDAQEPGRASLFRHLHRRYLCAYCNEVVTTWKREAVQDSWGGWCHGACLFKETGTLKLKMLRRSTLWFVWWKLYGRRRFWRAAEH